MLPNEVRTKLLFGNHDFSVLNSLSFPHLLDLFFLKNNLDVLGLGRVILNVNNVPIGLSHYISDKMLHFTTDITKEVLMVEGHSHLYFTDEFNRRIKLPALCDELKDSTYYTKRDLAKFGFDLIPLVQPYLNFVKSSFVDYDTIMFEELRQNDLGNVVSNEKVLVNIKTKEMKKYNN